MPTIFTRIIDGELPGMFVWRDDRAVAFMSINPLARGHVLVVPTAEVDHWIDLDPADPRHGEIDLNRTVSARPVQHLAHTGLECGFEVVGKSDRP